MRNNSRLRASLLGTLYLLISALPAYAQTTIGSGTDAAARASLDALAGALGRKPSNPIVYVPRGQGGPGYPSQPIPVCASAKPTGWPASDVGNLSNFAWWVFGTGYAPYAAPNCVASQVTSRTILDANFEHNQNTGSANTNIDGGSKDTNPGAFNGVFRSYPEGDPHDTTVIKADGLHLRAFCNAGMMLSNCQGFGNVVSGIIRPELEIPETNVVAELCARRPKEPWAWLTNWFYDGAYPPPSSSDVQFYQAGSGTNGMYPTQPYHDSSGNGFPNEIDWPDGFSIIDGVPAIHDLTPALPQPLRANQNKQPIFVANSGGFKSMGQNSEYLSTLIDQSANTHCYQVEKIAPVYSDPVARTNLLHHGHVVYSMDGVEYEDYQFDANGNPEQRWDGQPTGRTYMPQSWMVALQIAPTFRPNGNALMTYDRVAADDAVIVSMGAWNRTPGTVHVAPSLVNGIAPAGEQSVFPAPTFPLVFTGTPTPTSTPTNTLFSRASAASAVSSTGDLTYFAPGFPAITDRGLLLEGAANSVIRVADVNPINLNTPVTVAGPDGQMNAVTFTENTASNTVHLIRMNVSGPYIQAGPNTVAGWIKRSSGARFVRLQDGDDFQVVLDTSAGTVTTVKGSGVSHTSVLFKSWLYFTTTWSAVNPSGAIDGFMATDNTGSDSSVGYNGDGSSGFTLAYFQVQPGSVASSPIPANGRAAAQLSFTVPAGKTSITPAFSDGTSGAAITVTPGTVYTTPANGFGKPLSAMN